MCLFNSLCPLCIVWGLRNHTVLFIPELFQPHSCEAVSLLINVVIEPGVQEGEVEDSRKNAE